MTRFNNPQILLLALALIALTVSINAEVPQLINYQGRLTDSNDDPVNDTVPLIFIIYDSVGDAIWEEGHDGVIVTDGLFNVLLGSYANLPDDCFSGDTTRWLGIRVGDGEELEPRTRFTTAPYAYHALRADTAGYVTGGSSACGWVDDGDIVHLEDENDTVQIGTYNGGAAVNIYEPANDAVLHTTGLGVWTENGDVFGTTAGYFSANADGGIAKAVEAVSSSTCSDTVYAFNGQATNFGVGPAIGLYGYTEFEGEGDKIGVRGRGCGAGAGDTYGGHFTTAGGMTNTGTKYGVYGLANNLTASDAYGVYGEAYNPNEGNVYGGYFKTSGNGTGWRYGVHSLTEANNDIFAVAVNGEVKNYGSGSATGASFIARADGTGDKFGIGARAENDGSSYTYGVATSAFNSGNGTIYGVYTDAHSTGFGKTYGGHFLANSNADSSAFGLYADAEGYSKAGWSVYGIYARAKNNGTGSTIGGNFVGQTGGTGPHYGVYAMELLGGSGAAIYANGDFAASGTKSAVMRTSKGTVLMYAMESAEVWFEDFGEGKLTNGQAHIELDPVFLETVTIDNDHPMKVFIQLNDDCYGTYVKTSSAGFDVHELQRGTSDASFTYRVVAKRKGYEDERMRAAEIGQDDPNLFPERADEIYEKLGLEKPTEAE
jgi:hypothetical protein